MDDSILLICLRIISSHKKSNTLQLPLPKQQEKFVTALGYINPQQQADTVPLGLKTLYSRIVCTKLQVLRS
jgi:hypothetical protein